MAIKFTWRGFLKLLKKIIPVILGETAANAAPDKPKTGLFTVPTTIVTPLSPGAATKSSVSAAVIPGAVAAGAPATSQITVTSGLKVSWSQVGIVVLQLIVFARYIGGVTGMFVIPLGLEESVKGIIDQAGLLWQSIAGLVGLFVLYRLREAAPAKVVLAHDDTE